MFIFIYGNIEELLGRFIENKIIKYKYRQKRNFLIKYYSQIKRGIIWRGIDI